MASARFTHLARISALLPFALLLVGLALPTEARAIPPPLPPEYSTAVGPGFAIAYHPSARERVERLVPEIGAARAELDWQLGRASSMDVEIRIAGLDVELPQLAVLEGASESSDLLDPARVTARGGLLVPADRLIVLSAGPGTDGAQRDLEATLRYQLARLALLDAVPVGASPWFIEGYAAQFAHLSELGHSSTLVWAGLRGDVPRAADLADADTPLTEAFAAEAARYLTETKSGRGMQEWVSAMRNGATFEDAIDGAAGGPGELDRRVRDRITGRVAWVSVLSIGIALGVALGVMAFARRSRRRAARQRARELVQGPALELIDPILGKAEEAEPMIVRPPSPERVQHDGAWHTVH
ncbi:MAG: hypothetical protein U0414_10910 [Polyangiaceae bacterium]